MINTEWVWNKTIIPTYNTDDKPYVYDVDDKGLAHSYPMHPPGYSAPQLIYSFYYSGIVTKIPGWTKNHIWTVDPPFFILSGQGTSGITCELIPKLLINREPIKIGIRKLKWRDIKYSELNLQIGKWKETLNLYYKQGPLWKIEGNTNPKIEISPVTGKVIKKIETYTLVPKYDQSGYPPKNETDPKSYSFDIKNGTISSFYGDNPPKGNPKVDIIWHTSGPSYISFYSAWKGETVKFPNTQDIYVSV